MRAMGARKAPRTLTLYFRFDQEDPDDHPCKEGEGFMEIGHRGITGLDISREEG